MMNCTTARRFLYAFADGELAVKENCEVLDHLKMCPDCSRIASEQQELRLALRRSIHRTPLPAGLAERVAESIERGSAPTATAGGLRLWRIGVPLAAVASLAVVATTYWLRPSSDPAAPAPVARLPEGGDVAVQMVVKTHEDCTDPTKTHQNGELPQNLDGLSEALAAHFGGMLDVITPDFASFGYTLESANYCGFTKNGGAHLVYVGTGKNPKRLSFFVVPRWSSIDECGYYKGVTDDFLRKFGFPHGKPKYSVVAWHDNQTTYICCGRIGMEKLSRMLEPVRARKQPPAGP